MDTCLDCGADIPDGGTWGYCSKCWDKRMDVFVNNHEMSDGCTWTGTLDANGVRNGIGTKRYPNGATYTGTWVNNVRHGTGIKTWADGTQKYVTYVYGKLVEGE